MWQNLLRKGMAQRGLFLQWWWTSWQIKTRKKRTEERDVLSSGKFGFLFHLHFDSEDRANIFARNIGVLYELCAFTTKETYCLYSFFDHLMTESTRGLISLWLYKENDNLLDCKVYLCYIFPLRSTYLWLRCSNFFNPPKKKNIFGCAASRKIGIGKAKDLSAPSLIYLWLYSPLLDLGRFFSFLILYIDGRTVGTRDQPVAKPLPAHTNTEYTHADIHALSGIRTNDPSFRASEDGSCLRPRGHCVGLMTVSATHIIEC
jgi:hypothetical protein